MVFAVNVIQGIYMFTVPEFHRVTTGIYASTEKQHGNNGQFEIKRNTFGFPSTGKDIKGLFAHASDGGGWEHVSVSVLPKPGKKIRLPTHAEMEFIRFLFWGYEDWVIEFHPPATEYVSNAPCLHLWRPIGKSFPTPESVLVGVK